jgi:polyisoprenoid-binding protein YceI
LILAAAALLTGPVLAQQVIPAQSDISFVSKQMGVPVEGRFKQWTAQFAFDPRKPETGKVGFTIQTGSASFGAAETDAEVPKATWFNVAKFPQASFQSESIKALGGGKFEVRGKLSIKGATQDTVVPVSLTQTGSLGTAVGSFTIKRLDFKIGDGEWADTSMVANDVQVKFKLALSGLAPL